VTTTEASSPPQAETIFARVERRFPRERFSLQVEADFPAGITILFGPSGAGKSTLLDCLAGILAPDTGEIRLGPNVLFDREQNIWLPPRKRRIGYVFQSAPLFPHMSVRQNVEYGLHSLASQPRRARAQNLLETFRVAELADRKPQQISGGERQRVALARALAPEPRALLLDEPLSALDVAAKIAILEDLRQWQQRHSIPIVYVTHSRREAQRIGERMLVLHQGRIVAEGPPQQALASLPDWDD
jgi:molybdate transport system ATP-binding protein